ncbi:MAG: ribose 5-phosphate isomerase A [Syntrophales bacterium]
MTGDHVNVSQLKEMAALCAVDCVQSGMIVGLGHGSTAHYAVCRISKLLRDGILRDILCVPCSAAVEKEATELGIPLTTLDEHPEVDVTIDGADEIDPELNLIKGGGGALLHEKIVAQASRREIIIADESKLSPRLGVRRAVPVEVIPFGWRTQAQFLESLGAQVSVRLDTRGNPFITDEGNYILDCRFDPAAGLPDLAGRISSRAGVVEHGLWLGMATDVIVAGARGIRHLKKGTDKSRLDIRR